MQIPQELWPTLEEQQLPATLIAVYFVAKIPVNGHGSEWWLVM